MLGVEHLLQYSLKRLNVENVQVAKKMLVYALDMARHRPLQGVSALVGDRGVRASAVLRAWKSIDEPIGHHPVDESGQAAAAQENALGQVLHLHPTFGSGVKPGQDLIPCKWDALVFQHLVLERADRHAIGGQEGPPRRELLVANRRSHLRYDASII